MTEQSAEDELDAILADYIDSVSGHAAGDAPGPDLESRHRPYVAADIAGLRSRLVSRYPHLSRQLQGYFDDEDAFQQVLTEPEKSLPAMARYSELSVIGRGAMGIVYRAFDRQLGRWVALKVTQSGPRIAPEEATRFRLEAQSMARLRHPHIVPVFDTGEYEGHPFLSMGLIDGPSLDQQLDRFHADPSAIIRLMIDISRAVHHAHQREILHRDLKPANILVTHDTGIPHAWVCDFGLAKLLGGHDGAAYTPSGSDPQQTSTGAVLGTAAYMSPEQASGEGATTLSDIYGLGAVFYKLLTGCSPYRAASLAATLEQVGNPQKSVVAPRALQSDVDPTLEAICLKCLHNDPGCRYPSAEGVARDLERWRDKRMTEARPLGRLRRMSLWSRRNPVGGALTLAFLALFALVAMEVLEQLDEPRRAQQALAEQRAQSLAMRFDQLRQAVSVTAGDRSLADLFAHKKRGDLQQVMVAAGLDRVDLNGHSPFESWFAVDLRDGEILARWPAMSLQAQGIDLRVRHYVSGLLENPPEQGVLVSRVFRSLLDGLYKFGVSALVQDSRGDAVGVVVATVTTSAQMGLPPLDDDDFVTAVLARREAATRLDAGELPADASEYLILLHPAYERRTAPVWLPRSRLIALGEGLDHDYVDPVAHGGGPELKAYSGRWTAIFAPVANAEFVVVVQQRRSAWWR